MTREELWDYVWSAVIQEHKSWVGRTDDIMTLIDEYTGDKGDGYFCNMHGDDD